VPTVATPDDPVELVTTYHRDGYILRRRLIEPGFCDYLAHYLMILGETGKLQLDPVIPDAAFVYGDPAFDLLMASLTRTVEAHVGAELLPTYSFARVYASGSSLFHHRDRPSCEHSVSLHLASSGERWPLSLVDLHGDRVDVVQEPGDAVCYQGARVEHWRDPLPRGQHAQVFLHWVRADGVNAKYAFDGREGLGRPSVLDDPSAGRTPDRATTGGR
jgi:hypothetical protein